MSYQQQQQQQQRQQQQQHEQQQQYDAPKLGATFIPGGFDDYYVPPPMPDLVSPAPQRVMAELPGQIQEGIAIMELDASSPQRDKPPGNLAKASVVQSKPSYSASQPQSQAPPVNNNTAQPRPQPQPQPQTQPRPSNSYTSQPANGATSALTTDEPNFSAFPKLKHRTPNVPPSDEEREATLEAARVSVLNSTDPEAQLGWAEDTLNFIETSTNHDDRMARFRRGRSTTPPIERQMRVDAVNIVTFLADQQHPKADFMKGMWLEFGKFGFPEDKPEAFRAYKRAAVKGYARAEYRMGMQFESTNEPMKALQHYKVGETFGDSASCYRMGMMALMGQLGQQQDFGRAIQLIRYAADTADANAPQGSYVYGMLLARELPQISIPEIFLPLDIAGARMYIEKAAYLGFSKAQLKMGSAYELCSLGCELNPTLSLHYSALAARQGEPEAEMSISKWFLCGYEGLFPKNEEMAFKFAQRASASGLDVAEFAMGYFNEIGMYIDANHAKALEWYEKAARNGNKDAQGRIDAISSSRALSKKDHEQVAVSRIKSQHGSRRGERPERFAKPVQQLPTVQDEYSSTQTPANLPRPSSAAPGQGPRPGSVAPYPVDDRPVSVAPYPVGDNPPRATPRPAMAGGFLAVDQRPNPNLPDRRSYSGPMGSGAYPQAGSRPLGPPNAQGQGAPLPRPHSAVGNISSLPPAGTPVPQQRVASAGYLRPDYRQPGGPAADKPGSDRPVTSPGPPVPSKVPSVDIGFSAPPDPRADRANRTYQSQAAPNKRTEATRPSGPGSQTSHIPPPRKTDSAPPPGRVHNPSASTGAVMSGAITGPSQTSAPPPRESSFAASNVVKPAKGSKPAGASLPGKGPKTFEEMGVPQGKRDNDCIIM